jgi:hypothetical protein
MYYVNDFQAKGKKNLSKTIAKPDPLEGSKNDERKHFLELEEHTLPRDRVFH